MDRARGAKSFQPRPFAAKMSAKPYTPTAGSFLPFGNTLNIISRTRHKQRILNRDGNCRLCWVFFYISYPSRSLISHRNALVRHTMISAWAFQVLAFTLVGADGVDRNAGCLGKCVLRQATLFPHRLQPTLTGGKVRIHDLTAFLNICLMKRSIKADKLPACNTTVLVRQGISGSFEVFSLAFLEAFLYTDIN